VSLSTLAGYRLVADWISDAMLNNHINGKAINCKELLRYIAIRTDRTKVVRCTNYWMNWKQDVEHGVMSCHYLRLISWSWGWPTWERNISKPLMHEHDNQGDLVELSTEHWSCSWNKLWSKKCCNDGNPKASVTWGTDYNLLTLSVTMRRTMLLQQSTVRHYQQRIP